MDMQEGEEQESSQSMIEAELSIHEFNRMLEQEQRREEILHFKERLKSFGLSFSDLLEHLPETYGCKAKRHQSGIYAC